MKILCPTDFSENSINAIFWALNYLEQFENGALEILHCLQAYRRADMFVSLDGFMKEQAEKDIETLEAAIHEEEWKSEINITLFKADPKIFISQRAAKIGADLIVAGSKGLTSLKDMTVGSVTEQIARRSSLPLIIIPNGISFHQLQNVVIGMDEELMKEPAALDPLKTLLSNAATKLHLTQVVNKNAPYGEVNARIEEFFRPHTVEHVHVPLQDTITYTLNNYASNIKANILVLAHKQRSWIGRIFHHSIMKEKLFDLKFPVLIIPI